MIEGEPGTKSEFSVKYDENSASGYHIVNGGDRYPTETHKDIANTLYTGDMRYWNSNRDLSDPKAFNNDFFRFGVQKEIRAFYDPEFSGRLDQAMLGWLLMPGVSGQLKGLVGDVLGSRVNRSLNAVNEEVPKGTKVYRVWGDESWPYGKSWTPVDPRTVPNYRGASGLPNQNTGRFVSEGILRDPAGVIMKQADSLHGNKGGLPEFIIPDALKQIELQRVSGVNPGPRNQDSSGSPSLAPREFRGPRPYLTPRPPDVQPSFRRSSAP